MRALPFFMSIFCNGILRGATALSGRFPDMSANLPNMLANFPDMLANLPDMSANLPNMLADFPDMSAKKNKAFAYSL
ncbi:MAG: hypothetical protein LBH04_07915 [Tannerellaceae bacterium]|nr:hypothetical protein [Tannerellaceae bacterium]